MPSAHRYLCEDEKADMKECLFGEKRVKSSNYSIEIWIFLLVSSSTIYVSTSSQEKSPIS